MKCPVCNLDATDGASFCPSCGAKLPLVEGGGAQSKAGDGSSAAAEQSATAENVAAAAGRGRISDVPEQVLWEGTFSPKGMLGTYAGAAVATVVLIGLAIWTRQEWYWVVPAGAMLVLWIFVLGRLIAARLGVHYKLTNQMFYHQRGVLTRVTDRIELIEIHDVTYEQGLFDRMVNVGRIKIASNDRTDPIFYLQGVEDVSSVAQMIDKARRGEQVRRGRRIESLGVHES